MGRYLSEMKSDAKFKSEADKQAARRKTIAENIRKRIEAEGLEFVLADILDKATLMRIWCS